MRLLERLGVLRGRADQLAARIPFLTVPGEEELGDRVQLPAAFGIVGRRRLTLRLRRSVVEPGAALGDSDSAQILVRRVVVGLPLLLEDGLACNRMSSRL